MIVPSTWLGIQSLLKLIIIYSWLWKQLHVAFSLIYILGAFVGMIIILRKYYKAEILEPSWFYNLQQFEENYGRGNRTFL